MQDAPLPSPVAWAVFVYELRRLAQIRRETFGEADSPASLVEPLRAINVLLSEYDLSLGGAFDQVGAAVINSIDGKVHPLFRNVPEPLMTRPEGFVIAMACLLMRELVESRVCKTISLASELVYQDLMFGKQPIYRRTMLTPQTIKGWFYNHKRATANQLGKYKPTSPFSLNPYKADVEYVGAERRIGYLRRWLRQGSGEIRAPN